MHSKLNNTGMCLFYTKRLVKFFPLVFAICITSAVIYAASSRNIISTEGVSLDKGEVPSIQETLNNQAKDTGVVLYINTNIVAKTADSPANLLIQNQGSNTATWKVFVRRNDTGECVYESDDIPPGDKIESAKLQVPLEAGTYPCTAEFHVKSSNGDDKSVINVGVNITILA